MRHGMVPGAVALAALALGAPVAGAQSGPPVSAAAGVAHARAAGIHIDPGAAQDMAEAPIGSCYNDPTRAGCPPATRVEPVAKSPGTGAAWATFGLDSPGTPPPTASSSSPPTATSASARHLMALPVCFTGAVDLSKSTGNARATGTQYCVSSAVVDQELYTFLKEKWNSDGQWHQMDSGHGGPAGWTTRLYAYANYYCRDTNNRSWMNLSQGYAEDSSGAWHGDQAQITATLPCLG